MTDLKVFFIQNTLLDFEHHGVGPAEAASSLKINHEVPNISFVAAKFAQRCANNDDKINSVDDKSQQSCDVCALAPLRPGQRNDSLKLSE